MSCKIAEVRSTEQFGILTPKRQGSEKSMKIERINENQIRCTLTSSDLSARNLNLGELAYGTEKAKKLFHEMIQKASNEVGFEADDIPLMVEAIPLSSESIMLIITKIEDPEELDTRFSRFSPGNEDEPLTALANELLEGADGLLSLFTDNGKNTAASPLAGSGTPSTEKAEPGSKLPAARIFTFGSLDEVCRAARIAAPVCETPNTLYKHPSDGRYYLVVRQTADSTDAFNRLCNLLSEYSEPLKTAAAPNAFEAYYEEHYETIVREHALSTLSTL